ncbi:MAG: DUF2510 domain-containing protein [Leifsonia sp.]
MSDPNGGPVAAWYPDPETPGMVRWWDGMKWTEHVSVPANPVQSSQAAIQASVPQIAEADAALAAADLEHAAADGWASIAAAAGHGAGQSAAHSLTEPEHIGRHAAGAQPVPRETPRAPQIRPRDRVVSTESVLSA